MPRGSKEAYSDKQKRMAEHIEDSVKKRGGSEKTAERIGWATVNKKTGGAQKKKSSSTKKTTASKNRQQGNQAHPQSLKHQPNVRQLLKKVGQPDVSPPSRTT